MIIALDYDDCYTRDTTFWGNFVMHAERFAHHKVICVTARDVNHPITDPAFRLAVSDIVYAGRQPKRTAAEAAGYKVDVWIDDMPEMVGTWNFDTDRALKGTGFPL